MKDIKDVRNTNNMRLGFNEVIVGTVNFGSKVVVSDPMYELGTWCAGILDVVPGSYICKAIIDTGDDIGSTVDEIEIRHSKYGDGVEAEEEVNFTVGVDSAHCGIFNYELFREKDGYEGGKEKEWFNDMWDVDMADIYKGGAFVCTSGYGDGVYECLVGRDAAGDIVAVRVLF